MDESAVPQNTSVENTPVDNAPVVVDCDSCVVRSAAACGDCVVTVLLGAPPDGITLDESEVTALGVLAREGLVPPLRLVTPVTSREIEAS